MLKSKIICTLIFNFALVSIAQSSESGGMPQLNPEFWISQIFWLTIFFVLLFVSLHYFFLPRRLKKPTKKTITKLKEELKILKSNPEDIIKKLKLIPLS